MLNFNLFFANFIVFINSLKFNYDELLYTVMQRGVRYLHVAAGAPIVKVQHLHTRVPFLVGIDGATRDDNQGQLTTEVHIPLTSNLAGGQRMAWGLNVA